MHQPKKWEGFLPLVEFAYNNGYQESLNTSPFEELYGRKCNTPINWNDLVNRVHIGPDMLREMEHEMVTIRQKLKVAQGRQKSYAYQHRVHKEFKVAEHVYL